MPGGLRLLDSATAGWPHAASEVADSPVEALRGAWLPSRTKHIGVTTSFYIDCKRFFEGGIPILSGIMARIKCLKLKAQLKLIAKKEVMDQLPEDRNCKYIYFIYEREKRQWMKCCKQGLFPLFGKMKCQEVVPSGYYPARDKWGNELKWEKKEAQQCFRTVPHDCWNGGSFCHAGQEECVVLGDPNTNSYWPLNINDGARPPAYVYWMQSPPAFLATPALPRAQGRSHARRQSVGQAVRVS